MLKIKKNWIKKFDPREKDEGETVPIGPLPVLEAGMEKEKASEIVDKIIADISDRSGLGNEWDMTDSDIRDEIRNTWIEIVSTT